MNGDDHDPDHDHVNNFLDDPIMGAIDAEIIKIKKKHDDGTPWSLEDKMNIYTTVYEWAEQTSPRLRVALLKSLIKKYERILKARISQKVIPSLSDKVESEFRTEITKQWSEFKKFTKDVVKIFSYPSRDPYSRYVSSTGGSAESWFCELVEETFKSQISADETRDLLRGGED